jgi:predicted DNA-binding transcriptional regulator AlpA
MTKNVDLWTSDDVARELKLDVETFNRRVKPLPGFPKASTIPMLYGKKITRSRPRWRAEEVRAWIAENVVSAD